MKKKTVILGVCASIAAHKACDIINRLKGKDIDIIVCMSRDAENFITPLTLQTLSGNRVLKNMFETTTERDPLHISLAERADAILIAPASADIISKISSGLCDDLLTCIITSTKAPVLLAPAMNEQMYRNEIIQANIDKLKKLGYKFIGPIKGNLACGRKGMGHIADTGDIVKELKSLLK